MKNKLHTLINKKKTVDTIFNSIFFRLSNSSDKAKLNQLLDAETNICVLDELQGQLEELVKCQNPKTRFNKNNLTEAAKKHTGDIPYEEYGVWVYYPWSYRLVHILDEKEFIEVRTNRNQYKITPAEKATLATKKIGILGLSVGQSIALTIAMERSCNELRIADFDILELSNLNRIRAGVHNLGVQKTVVVAREIAEIDPYLKVICYHEGANETNIDDFLLKNGKLDILVDECDGLHIKILCRQQAKKYQIPVVMDTSDRGMVDIERFDLEPNRPILHGLIDHLDINKVKEAKTNEEKVPYLLPMLGIDTLSTRMKASMLEIEQTSSTWPQLASAVSMGGGLGADVCRRILLNHYTESGRYYIDVEELIRDMKEKTTDHHNIVDFDYPELTINEMEKIAKSLTANTVSIIDDGDLTEIVKAAIIAPSAANNQPWKWLSFAGNLFFFHDKKQSISWTDYNDLISYVSFGAAIENINLKSDELGYNAKSILFPLRNNEKLIAVFSFEKKGADHKPQSGLHQFLTSRCTNRKKGKYTSINRSILDDIKHESESIKDVIFSNTIEKNEIEKISKIVAISERIRFLNPQGHHDFYSKEIKWNKNGDQEILEGLDIRTLELNNTDEIGLKVAANPKVIELINRWKVGGVFEKSPYKSISTSSVIGIISMPEYSKQNWVNGGRAIERAWLSATKHQLAFHPVSAPFFLYMQILNGGGSNFSDNDKYELEKCYADLTKIFPSLEKNLGVFIFRLSHAEPPTAISLRKKINELYYKTII
jgi:hypothetical protein